MSRVNYASLVLGSDTSGLLKAKTDLAAVTTAGAKTEAGIKKSMKGVENAVKPVPQAARDAAAGMKDLRMSLDPLYASSKKFEAVQKQVAAAVKKGATTQAEANRIMALAEDRYLGMGGAAEVAATRMGGGAGGLAYQSRMAAMQLSQVAQQTAATGSFIQALSIQLPDLALGFGALGIGIGVVAGALLPLAANFVTGGEGAMELSDALDNASSELAEYIDLMSQSDALGAERFERTRGQIELTSQAYADLIAIAKIEAFNSIEDLNVSLVESTLNARWLKTEMSDVGRLLEINTTNASNITVWKENREQVRAFISELEALRDASSLEEQYAAALQLRDAFKQTVDVNGELTEEQLAFWKTLSQSIQKMEIMGAAIKAQASGMSEVEQAAAKAAQQYAKSRLEAERSASAASELLSQLQQEAKVRSLTLRYGADSVQVAEARLDAERRSFVAQVQSRDISESLKRELIAAWDAANGAAGASSDLSGKLSQASAFAAQLVANLGQVPGAVAAIAGQVDSAINSLQTQNRSLTYQLEQGITASAAAIKAQRDEALKLAAENGATIDQLAAMGQSFDEQAAKAEKLATANKTMTKTLSDQAAAAAAASAGSTKLGKSTGGAGKAMKAAAKEAEKLANEIERLEFGADPVAKFNHELANLNELAANGLSDGAFQHAVSELNEEFMDSYPNITKIGDAIGDFVASGMKDFGDLLDSFKSMLAEMISTAISNPIRLALIGGVSGGGMAGTAAQAAGAAPGGGGILGGLGGGGGLGGMAGTFIGGLAGGGTGLIGGAANVISSFGMGGFGSAFASIGHSLAGATSGLAGLGAAIGAIAVPVLAVAAVFSFFKKKVKVLDSGMRITVDGMDALIESFKKTETSRFWGLSKKVRTTFEALDAETAAPFERLVGNIQQGVLDAADSLNIGAGIFDDFSHQIKISTKGLSDEEVQQAVADALQDLSDEFAGMVPGLEELQREGEGASDALTRLSAHLSAVNMVMDTLSQTMFEASLAGADMASGLIEYFGGLDAFNSATTAYFQGFYTEQERFNTAVRQIEERFSELNVSMPQTRAQFREMIEGLDLTTEYGRQMYASLMSMSGALSAVLPAIENFSIAVGAMVGSITTEIDGLIGTASEAMQANEQAASMWYRTATTLREFIADMRGTAGALVSSRDALAFSEARFQTLLASAVAGDNEAATDLTAAARTLLTNTKATARTAAEQARAEARVLADLQLVAGVSDVEGARHDVVSGLLGQQVELLNSVRDAINSGNTLEPEDIDGLNAQLGSLQSAIAAAEMINFQFLKERLEVSVDLIADADIPDSLRTMLNNASDGITANIDYIVRADALTPDLRWLALTAASEHIKTIDYVVGDDISPSNRWIATTAVSSLTKTLNLTIGEKLTSDQMRVALAGSSEMSRVVNVTLNSGASQEAIRLALGNVNRYQVIVGAALESNLSDEVQRLVIAQQGDYAAIIGAAMSADMTEAARRILLTRQGDYIARIGAVLATDMPTSHRLLLLNANTAATRAVTILMGYAQHLTHSERALLIRESDRITRTIDAATNFSQFQGRDWTLFNLQDSAVSKTVRGAINLVGFGINKERLLEQSTEVVNKTVRGAIDLSRLNETQSTFLTAITGATTGRITLGGTFSFDPTTGFSTWFSTTTRSNITSPMDALRTGMASLRGSLGELAETIREEIREREAERERETRIAALTARAVNSTWSSDAASRSASVVSRIEQLERDTGVSLRQGDGDAILSIGEDGRIRYNASHVVYGRGDDIDAFRAAFWADGGLEDQIFAANQNLSNNQAWLTGLRRQVVELGGIPAFANGGFHSGGLRVVGERGPELEMTGPSRIHNANDTRKILGNDNSEVVRELQQLRAELADLKRQSGAFDAEKTRYARKTYELQERQELRAEDV
ncbi:MULTISPECIES: hypothetical protein [Sulfitobacter]|uniref:hypothetical protein n=1 Tax=Sulfitobacter TaxID=60136 RepID=UPI002455E2CB|nr:hypothetical protein [Sulfitobacter faviae]MDH4541078.1 hypothetical protein [Sulfitobacter faviae]